MSGDFKPVSNGFSFACTSSYNLEETASESQIVQATHVDLIGELTSEANTNMINADNDEMEEMPLPPDNGDSDPNYSTEVQEWQTQYNLINTTGQMYVNELQTEAQNDATNLQSIGNFIQNLLQIQSAILSPLDTVTALLQKDL
ncbi:MAG: hypothetical protein KFB93_04530 [Simkaniaceae bacterium]|nr:MAG: hypothetical protein KFB93_04530 [Simkaniaceae bacterium]